MEQGKLVGLLAGGVATTGDVVTSRATAHQPGAELAQAVGLDMAAWWQPTAEGYFKHVSKAVILEAVGEFAPSHATRLAKLKKADIASEAERLADGRSEEHTSELQSLMRISYAVFCLKKKKNKDKKHITN